MLDYQADDAIVIIDFETTGLSSDCERIIEVGAALVSGGKIQSTFSALCDPGFAIPSFITGLTGITNAMLRGQRRPEQVMTEFYDYIGDRPLVAHNASFDCRFLKAEMLRIGKLIHNPSVCTMLLSRRLIRNTADHKLGTLKRYIDFDEEAGHADHRALDDVKVTASLWFHLQALVQRATGMDRVPLQLLQSLSRLSKDKVQARLEKLAQLAV